MCGCNRRFLGTKPFLEDDEAEKNFVIVVAPGSVLPEQLVDRGGTKELIYFRAAVQEGLRNAAVDGPAEPAVLRSLGN